MKMLVRQHLMNLTDETVEQVHQIAEILNKPVAILGELERDCKPALYTEKIVDSEGEKCTG